MTLNLFIVQNQNIQKFNKLNYNRYNTFCCVEEFLRNRNSQKHKSLEANKNYYSMWFYNNVTK